MSGEPAIPAGSDISDGDYWDDVYRHGDTNRSWYQHSPAESLRLLADAQVPASASVLDVGGGASTLVDCLLRQGCPDVTVLDISAGGMGAARRRLGAAASAPHWIRADLTSWRPRRTYDVWHDRALLHFFTTTRQQADYLRVLHEATHPGSVAVIATFAADGPDHCSGLPVTHRDPSDLLDLLGDAWEPLATRRQLHTTPTGSTQSFAWITARRLQRAGG